MAQLLIDQFSFDSLQVISENKDTGTMNLRGICQRAEAPNKNNRVYSKALLEKAIGNLEEMINTRRLIGELDHPSGPTVSLKNASHIVTKVHFDSGSPNDVLCEVEILNTPAGKVAQQLIKDGVKLGISSRALGSLGRTDTKGHQQVDEQDFKLITWDLVADPSTHEAFVGQMNEGTEVRVPLDIQKKISSVIREKTIIEAFKQSFKVNEDTKQDFARKRAKTEKEVVDSIDTDEKKQAELAKAGIARRRAARLAAARTRTRNVTNSETKEVEKMSPGIQAGGRRHESMRLPTAKQHRMKGKPGTAAAVDVVDIPTNVRTKKEKQIALAASVDHTITLPLKKTIPEANLIDKFKGGVESIRNRFTKGVADMRARRDFENSGPTKAVASMQRASGQEVGLNGLSRSMQNYGTNTFGQTVTPPRGDGSTSVPASNKNVRIGPTGSPVRMPYGGWKGGHVRGEKPRSAFTRPKEGHTGAITGMGLKDMNSSIDHTITFPIKKKELDEKYNARAIRLPGVGKGQAETGRIDNQGVGSPGKVYTGKSLGTIDTNVHRRASEIAAAQAGIAPEDRNKGVNVRGGKSNKPSQSMRNAVGNKATGGAAHAQQNFDPKTGILTRIRNGRTTTVKIDPDTQKIIPSSVRQTMTTKANKAGDQTVVHRARGSRDKKTMEANPGMSSGWATTERIPGNKKTANPTPKPTPKPTPEPTPTPTPTPEGEGGPPQQGRLPGQEERRETPRRPGTGGVSTRGMEVDPESGIPLQNRRNRLLALTSKGQGPMGDSARTPGDSPAQQTRNLMGGDGAGTPPGEQGGGQASADAAARSKGTGAAKALGASLGGGTGQMSARSDQYDAENQQDKARPYVDEHGRRGAVNPMVSPHTGRDIGQMKAEELPQNQSMWKTRLARFMGRNVGSYKHGMEVDPTTGKIADDMGVSRREGGAPESPLASVGRGLRRAFAKRRHYTLGHNTGQEQTPAPEEQKPVPKATHTQPNLF